MMAPATPPAEPITAEPVIVEKSDALKLNGDESQEKPSGEKKPSRKEGEGAVDDEDSDLDIHVRKGRRGRRWDRSYSPPPPPPPPGFRRDVEPIKMLKNASSLNQLILEPTDAAAETSVGLLRSPYITSYAFHAEEVRNISWLFTMGLLDAWMQRPVSYHTPQGFQFELPLDCPRRQPSYYENRYNSSQDAIPFVRLGSAFRVFKNDSDEYMTSKVKFVIAVQGAGSTAWYKLVMGYSRQTALAAIYHEILNNNSIAFVGAVLQEVSLPVGAPTPLPAVKFQKATSVQELEEMEKGVIGIIC